MTAFVVGDDGAGDRLDVALAGHLGVSRSQAAATIDAGLVTVGGRTGSRSHRLQVGDRIEVAAPVPPQPLPVPRVPPIRYEDDHVLVVAKPAGLVVHPGAGHPGGTLVDALRAAGFPLAPAGGDERPGIVHRLDRDTSGLLLVAKTDAAHAALVAALQRREVSRCYLALVAGVPRQARGRIEAPIGRDPRDRKRFAVVAGGKPAVTHYRVVTDGQVPGVDSVDGRVALLRCDLETGRTHQIRVHLSGLGHPVLGDRVYGRRASLAAVLGLDRPFLHAARLTLRHPSTGAVVDITEPLPEELARALRTAGVTAPVLDLPVDPGR